MTHTNGHYKDDLAETIAAQTLLLEDVRDHLKKMPDNLKDIAEEIKGIVREMHAFNVTLTAYSHPKTGYVAKAIEVAEGKKMVSLTTHLITTAALAVCLVAAILALTNSDMNYGDFYIGKKKHAIEPSRD